MLNIEVSPSLKLPIFSLPKLCPIIFIGGCTPSSLSGIGLSSLVRSSDSKVLL
jgi:hypothetical protein